MSSTFSWFGLNLRESKTDERGRAGVVVNGTRMLNNVFAAAQRIYDAGQDGLDRYAVGLGDVEACQRAGINITSNACGTRWYLTEKPVADLYLIEERAAESKRPGKFGTALGSEKAPYTEPHPWTLR